MDDPVYYLELQGRQVGPYDRRTIVGMRIKGTLASDHALVTVDGARLTVADLLRRDKRKPFNPGLSGSYSLVQATYAASLVEVQGGGGVDIPAFRGEVEARVQSDVLRLSGRFRQGMSWKEDRIKLPLRDIAHARIRGTVVDLWVRQDGQKSPQSVTLELFTPEAAGEFVEWLPRATPWPASAAPAAVATGGNRPASHALVWAAVVGTVVVVGVVLAWVLSRP